jgi:type II secretory pathway pseudopilin PulG
MLGGIVGGVVGPRVQALVESAAIQRAQAAAAHDQAILKSAQEWEARQRQMYPVSTSTSNQDVLKPAQERAERYRHSHPRAE